MTYRPLILFVCTGNTCRSAMAKRLFSHLLEQHGDQDRFRAASAGVWAHGERSAAQEAVSLLGAEGLDLSAHQSRGLTQQMVDEADLILAMERAHLRDLGLRFARADAKAHLLSAVVGERRDVTDPMGQGQDAYSQCYETLRTYLTEGYQQILVMAEGAPPPPRTRRWPWRQG